MRGAQGERRDLAQVRRRPKSVVSAPVDMLALPPFPLHLARSLGGNNIGANGASALAAVLKKTMITNLECAAALSVHLSVNAR